MFNDNEPKLYAYYPATAMSMFRITYLSAVTSRNISFHDVWHVTFWNFVVEQTTSMMKILVLSSSIGGSPQPLWNCDESKTQLIIKPVSHM
jgi:hypothetical protein